MAITQLSLFLTNQPGTLVDAVGVISSSGANIRAMSIAEANDFGILRIIVSDADQVCEALQDRYLVSRNPVVAVRMDDRSGALYGVLAALRNGGINIEYMYAFTSPDPDAAYVVFRVSDTQAAELALKAAGFVTLTDENLKL